VPSPAREGHARSPARSLGAAVGLFEKVGDRFRIGIDKGIKQLRQIIGDLSKAAVVPSREVLLEGLPLQDQVDGFLRVSGNQFEANDTLGLYH
jgi:hypothetical protein